MIHPRIEDWWHKDQAGQAGPNKLIGKTFVHLKTNALYVVHSAMFNATSQKWCVQYDRINEDEQKPFRFVRDMDEFLDGRFLEVK